MRVSVNGQSVLLPQGSSLQRLLELEREPGQHALVEVNGQYVPARLYAERLLADDDRIEIILPAFGG